MQSELREVLTKMRDIASERPSVSEAKTKTALKGVAFLQSSMLSQIMSACNGVLRRFPASPSPISADAVVEACAKVADDVEEMRERLFRENGTSHNAVRASQANSIAAAIRALKGTFPAVDGSADIRLYQRVIDEMARIMGDLQAELDKGKTP